MYIKIEGNSFKLLKTCNSLKPLEFNIKQTTIKDYEVFETIKIEDGKIYNLPYHQKRVESTFKNLYNSKCKVTLKDAIKNYPTKSLYRVKVTYNQNGIIDCSYYIYSKKDIKTLALVELPNFLYNYKYINREVFNKLYKEFPNFDEFIITKNGYLQDTTIANIALLHRQTKQWHTPKESLLDGTTKERYLKSSKLIKKMIHFQDLKNYTKVATLNAMVDFNILKAN